MPKIVDESIRICVADPKEINDELRRQIPARLRRAMDDRGWSSVDLAHRSGVRQATISGWLRGEYLPRLDQLGAVADALGMSRGQLAYGG